MKLRPRSEDLGWNGMRGSGVRLREGSWCGGADDWGWALCCGVLGWAERWLAGA